jgi:phenylacetate-coenzyme A ligase PaaK-like adenylate-forming protein
LAKGKITSRLAGRPMLPRDLWKIKGIIGSGVDSCVYKEKIKDFWGRYPLDLYSSTEGGVMATQAWDYTGMTFIPNLNFLEFIPDEEQLKLQMDSSYKPKTLLLNEVKAGESYELVITSFHGGAMIRYRIGDLVKITALSDEKIGVKLPQMAFDRRVDDFLDFYFVTFTEKIIWQALEKIGISYEDWVAFKDTENMVLNIGIELKEGSHVNDKEIASLIFNELAYPENDKSAARHDDLMEMADFKIQVELLPKGTFAAYTARRQAENADPAHLKPRHVNPAPHILSVLTADVEETIVVTKTGADVVGKTSTEQVKIP